MNVLIKPVSDSNGNLVILADNTDSMTLVDVTTGEIIEQGRNDGASNGRGATFRFSKPGVAYENVGLMDDKGNVIVTLATAGDRIQFNYNDYDALVKTPVSTIPGYRWSNDKNTEAKAAGQPSNADIASMTPEEYQNYLESQKTPTANKGSSPSVSGQAALGAASPFLIGAATGVDPLQEAQVLTGIGQGPLTETESQALGIGGDVAGGLTAAYNNYGAFNQLRHGDTKNVIKGGATVVGTAIGAYLGGPVGAGIGSTVGKVAGRGIASAADRLGLVHKSTKQFQQDRWGSLGQLIDPNSPTGQYIQDYQQHIQEGPKGEPKKFQDMTAEDLVPGLGFFQEFGNDWLEKATPEQRVEVARRAQQENLVESKKGDILLTDPARVREIWDDVLSKPPPEPKASVAPVTAPTQATQGLTIQGAQNVPPPQAFQDAGARELVPSDPNVEPPISDYQEIPGELLPPPGADNEKLAALSFLQSAPSRAFSNQFLADAFQSPQIQSPAINFEQLQRAFQ